jgi:hypothetical protein
MTKGREILVLRDQAGTPYVVPQTVVEQEELVAFRVDDDDYLLARKTLLKSVVPDGEPTEVADGLLIRAPDGTRAWLSAATLDRARVVSDEERAAAAEVLEVEAVARAQLEFEITPLGRTAVGFPGRGAIPGAGYVS